MTTLCIGRLEALLRFAAMATLLVVIAGLSGCSTSKTSPPPAPEIIQPAVIPKPKAHREVASWYGPGFNGHLTSTGERFNQNELTAASKTLPLGSTVLVTNPSNGKSVRVRINDRGPFVRGRTIDLSKRAAEKLGMTRKGVAHVVVTPVPKRKARATPLPPAASPPNKVSESST